MTQRIAVLLGGLLFATCASAAQPSMLTATVAMPAGQQWDRVDIQYRTPLLPRWAFDMRLSETRESSFPQPLAMPNAQYFRITGNSIRLAARRALPLRMSQWIYASFESAHIRGDDGWWIPLMSDTQVAASVGWQFGESDAFGLNVGYEVRELGELTNNSLIMGMHYQF